jgi:hypothetical protein
MAIVSWLITLGTSRAAANAGAVLEARRRAEAHVDAVAVHVSQRVPAAA